MGQCTSSGVDPAPVVSDAAVGAAQPGAVSAAPRVSVIIATYNWSAALACAIRSVQRQTLQDFEILVVGDACTDDSEALVASFGDPRIVWSNLAHNAGSQQAPNNAALAMARGEWIAYLGHDDIWAPRHLESTIAAACAAGSQVAAAGMIMYGAPGSGATWTAGLFADGRCADDDFVPPSALVHQRALIDRIGAWADPRTLRLPTDCEFFMRARAASPVAPSNEVTVFKFSAAARRNAYQAKSIVEQQCCLANLERGEHFVAEELVKLLQSRMAGRSWKLLLTDTTKLAPGELFRANRVAKGVEHRFDSDALRSLDAAETFTLDHEPASFEWHAVEHSARHGAFRWTGSAARSTVEWPVRLDRPLAMRIHVVHMLAAGALQALVVEAQGQRVATTVARTDAGTWLVDGVLDPALHASRVPYVQVTLSGIASARPLDIGISADRRRLGVAIGAIELAPLTRSRVAVPG